jgi:catalase
MLQKFMVAMLMAGLTVIAAADTVYKWSDSRGQIHYTDLPPTQSDAKVLSVSHRESASRDDEPAGDEGNDNSNGSESDGSTIDHKAMAAVEADVSSAKVKQCKEAKERYQRYVESRRLFRQTADGKREYLTDQQLNEARVKAKQAIDENCG